MLPLTFTNPQDYNKVDPSDRVSIIGLADNSMQLTLLLHKERGDTVEVPLSHTFSKGKIITGFFFSLGFFPYHHTLYFGDGMSMMRKC